MANALRGRGGLVAAAAYLAAAALFGGGSATWNLGYMLLIVATAVLAGALAWRDGLLSFREAPLAGRIALAGIAIIPLVQLVPLPPALWQALPGQELRRMILGLAGLADTWQPISVEPLSTAIAAVLAAGFVALVGLLLRLSDEDFSRAMLVAWGLIMLNVLVGLLQVVTDGRFPKLYPGNFGGTMLGFFANKNHMALAIACSMPLFGFVVSRRLLGRDKRKLATIGYLVFALVCIVTTNSRAGLALGALAAAIVLASLARDVSLRVKLSVLALAVAFAAIVLSSSAFETVSGRLDDVNSDLRWRFAIWSWPLAERYALLGAGAGSYATLFAAHEQLGWLKPTFVNHVHNDYLEIVIEMGAPALVVLALLALSLMPGVAALRSLAHHSPRRAELFFGLSVVLLFLLHSAIDYPARRPAAWVLLALGLAAVYRAARAARREVAATATNSA